MAAPALPTIVAVAMRHRNGLVLTMPIPHRHHHILHAAGKLYDRPHDGQEWQQGFLTSTGQFVMRNAAKHIALKAGQITAAAIKCRSVFTSEELW